MKNSPGDFGESHRLHALPPQAGERHALNGGPQEIVAVEETGSSSAKKDAFAKTVAPGRTPQKVGAEENPKGKANPAQDCRVAQIARAVMWRVMPTQQRE